MDKVHSCLWVNMELIDSELMANCCSEFLKVQDVETDV